MKAQAIAREPRDADSCQRGIETLRFYLNDLLTVSMSYWQVNRLATRRENPLPTEGTGHMVLWRPENVDAWILGEPGIRSLLRAKVAIIEMGGHRRLARPEEATATRITFAILPNTPRL